MGAEKSSWKSQHKERKEIQKWARDLESLHSQALPAITWYLLVVALLLGVFNKTCTSGYYRQNIYNSHPYPGEMKYAPISIDKAIKNCQYLSIDMLFHFRIAASQSGQCLPPCLSTSSLCALQRAITSSNHFSIR
jgi:hypothetical protein